VEYGVSIIWCDVDDAGQCDGLFEEGIRTVLQTWRMMPLCVMWCLWRERNARNFEDHELGLMELKKRVIQTLFLWRVMWHSPQVSTFAEFLEFCTFFLVKRLFCGLCLYTSYVHGLRPLHF
jgi:hypothetical protein